jgi:P-type E1-E2 ATPase
VIVLDKTGTVTKGKPELTDVLPAPGVDAASLLRMAAAADQPSEHPLAQAIVEGARSRGLDLPEAASFEAVPGHGVVATVEGERILIGNERLMRREGIDLSPLAGRASALAGEGKTPMFVSAGGRPTGVVAVADTIKEDSVIAIRQLRRMGLQVVMLTGDNERTARAIARQAGIDEVLAEVLPGDKALEIHRMKAAGARVGMVGDGINDAPALAEADVGIAMGVAGTDVALETADVALMADDLEHLADLVEISRRTRATIRQNIVLALLTMAILVTAALLGLMTVVEGLVLNEGAALLVIANALRLLRMEERLPTHGRTGHAGHRHAPAAA